MALGLAKWEMEIQMRVEGRIKGRIHESERIKFEVSKSTDIAQAYRGWGDHPTEPNFTQLTETQYDHNLPLGDEPSDQIVFLL